MRWLILLLLCGYTALLPADEPAATNQDPDVYWQSQDWQEAGSAQKIGNQVLIQHKSEQGYRLGLALLLPDWQQVADLLPLSHRLNRLGFDTQIMLPSPFQLELDPNSEKDQPAIEQFRSEWQQHLSGQLETAGQDGYRLIIAAGSSAAWLGNLISKQAMEAPDALVLVDAFYPDKDANAILARDMAGVSCPVLDMYTEELNSWLTQASQSRRIEARRANKLDLRQVALHSAAERSTVLSGWLRHLGWH